jgi:hypothetical protein
MLRKFLIALVFVMIGLTTSLAQPSSSVFDDNLTILDIERVVLPNGDLLMTVTIRALAGPDRILLGLGLITTNWQSTALSDNPVLTPSVDGRQVMDLRDEVDGIQDYLRDVTFFFPDYCRNVVEGADRLKIEVRVAMVTTDTSDDFYFLYADSLFDVPSDFCDIST